MKNQFNKYFSLLLLLIVLLSLIPAQPVVATTQETEVYYGEAYNDLKTDEQRLAYRIAEESIASLSPRINFEGVVEINYKNLQDVLRAVCVDNPQYFWFLEEGKFTYDTINYTNYIVSFEPKYVLDGGRVSVGSQELIDAVYAFHTKVQQIIAGIPINYTTDYEIALYLHDYLADNVTYTLEGEHPSAYAALIHGEAACYGYSKAYQCLLNAAGIRARTITGESPDENGKLSGHAWNQIWLDGDCYYADVTWDDFEVLTMHKYFAVSLEDISRDHIADPEFILPECSHDRVNYYTDSQGPGTAGATPITTASEIAALFRLDSFSDGEAVFGCEIHYSGDAFFDWFDNVAWDICQLLGLSNRTNVYYYQMYDVYYLQMIDPDYSINGPIVSTIRLNDESVTMPCSGTQFQLQPEIASDSVWTPDLVYTSSDTSVLTVDANGLVTSVSEGTATITVSSQDGSVSALCVFVVNPEPEHVHTMRMFTKKEATCTQDGHETYYLCTGCGLRFADEAGAVEYNQVSAFVLPATGHVDINWVKRFEYHQQQCRCGDEVSGTKEKHKDDNLDNICDVCDAGILSEVTMREPTEEDVFKAGWIIALTVTIPLGIVAFFVIRRLRRGF